MEGVHVNKNFVSLSLAVHIIQQQSFQDQFSFYVGYVCA
jgi:hypothetical protein